MKREIKQSTIDIISHALNNDYGCNNFAELIEDAKKRIIESENCDDHEAGQILMQMQFEMRKK